MASIYLLNLLKITRLPYVYTLFFFNDTATTEIYTLSLHDALPICLYCYAVKLGHTGWSKVGLLDLLMDMQAAAVEDRKSTRLNSSHSQISYAVFCLKKKKSECTSRITLRS